MSQLPDNYWEKIPKWNSDLPERSFVITADKFSGRIPVTRIDDWHDFTHLLESAFLINLMCNWFFGATGVSIGV